MVRAEKLVPGTGIRSLHLRDMQPVRTVPHTICSPICTYAAVRRPYAVKHILIVIIRAISVYQNLLVLRGLKKLTTTPVAVARLFRSLESSYISDIWDSLILDPLTSNITKWHDRHTRILPREANKSRFKNALIISNGRVTTCRASRHVVRTVIVWQSIRPYA